MTQRGARVVVGVDASPASRAAFDWTISASALSIEELHLVHAWSAYVDPAEDAVQRDPQSRRRRAVALLASFEAMVPTERAVPVASLVEGWAGHVLVAEARAADLLVIGRRDLGAISRYIRRSVSSYALRHATCPLVVVREVLRH